MLFRVIPKLVHVHVLTKRKAFLSSLTSPHWFLSLLFLLFFGREERVGSKFSQCIHGLTGNKTCRTESIQTIFSGSERQAARLQGDNRKKDESLHKGVRVFWLELMNHTR
jgi:hypothetical protein